VVVATKGIGTTRRIGSNTFVGVDGGKLEKASGEKCSMYVTWIDY